MTPAGSRTVEKRYPALPHQPAIPGGDSMSRMLLTTALAAAMVAALSAQTASAGYPVGGSTGCYPPIHAPLYPCPRPDVPREVGWTLITNPALSPHEMTYAHSYHAPYPPYYYKKSFLACIPFFPKPCLKGTEVCVKYHNCHPLLCPGTPACRTFCPKNYSWK